MKKYVFFQYALYHNDHGQSIYSGKIYKIEIIKNDNQYAFKILDIINLNINTKKTIIKHSSTPLSS